MRLLLVSQDFPPAVGGIQTYAVELAERLQAHGVDVTVVAPTAPKAAAIDAALSCTVRRLPVRPDLLVAPLLHRLPRWMRADPHDVVLHAQWQTVPASLVARRFTGAPSTILCAGHGRELLYNPYAQVPLLGRLYDAARRALVQRVDHAFPVSRYNARLMERLGVPRERLTVLHNGTDPALFAPTSTAAVRERLGLSADQPVVFTACRLVERKGVATVLRALPAVAAQHPSVQYLVAGDGPDRKRLQRLVHTLEVDRHVEFLGNIDYDQLPAYYSASNVFVMTPHEAPPQVEGFGIVFLEANACEVPVVGSQAGGIPDAVQDGKTGLLVPPEAPEPLAEAVNGLLANPARARQMGRYGRQRVVDELSWDAVAGRMHATITRVAERS
ncbi:glycosyltransferase family 4 protein [Salisaeta longa]|uniref:glycosyltransferase family 4 protein n=1 Tax=Salisaeta longa TaxID=503170 RepID=UPI0003B5CFD9|nr:glycosyltransferase family 4 protein [Salisaeta longa]